MCALLAATVVVQLRTVSSDASAALLAARRPRRISSSDRGRPDWFKLDQLANFVAAGQHGSPLRPELAALLGVWRSPRLGRCGWSDSLVVARVGGCTSLLYSRLADGP